MFVVFEVTNKKEMTKAGRGFISPRVALVIQQYKPKLDVSCLRCLSDLFQFRA
jgi:hypothetical protein